jgi:hypothetical protein
MKAGRGSIIVETNIHGSGVEKSKEKKMLNI